MIWQDGTMYEGGWEEDKQHGIGVFTLLNGNKWEGEFMKGKAVGIGQFTNPISGHSDERKFED